MTASEFSGPARSNDKSDAAIDMPTAGSSPRSPYQRRRLSPAQTKELRDKSRLLPKGGKARRRREPNRDKPRLAVYERVSRGDDDSVSMQRQRMENMAHAARLGAVVDWDVDVFWDYGVSAAGGHYRQGAEALIEALGTGKYDGVLFFEIPRLVRDEDEAAIFKSVMLQNSVELYVVVFPELSLWGATAPMFDMLVKLSAGEVQAMSYRTTSWHFLMSKEGAVRCQAPFGMTSVVSERRVDGRVAPIKEFAPDWEPRPELGGRSRAELVQGAAMAILAGESATSIARQWNAAGYRAGRGGLWTAGALTRIFRTPKIAGIAHRGSALLDVNGDEVPQGRELDAALCRVNVGLLKFEDWFALQATLAGRVHAVDRRTVRERVLRGLVRCGRCGSRMEAGGASYRCASSQVRRGGCGGNMIAAHQLERIVVGSALRLIKDPELRLSAASRNEPSRTDRVAALESEAARLVQRMDRLAEAYLDLGDDEALRHQFASKREEITRELTHVKSSLRALHEQSRRRLSDALAKAEDVDAEWAGMSTHLQNSILHELIGQGGVRVDPVAGWTREVDAGRVWITWAAD